MGREPDQHTANDEAPSRTSAVWGFLTAIAVVVGIALVIDTSFSGSATYDEVAYLRVAARWWRTGDQAEITRMGSPLTFWKLEQMSGLFSARSPGPAPMDRRPDRPSARPTCRSSDRARAGSGWLLCC